jgi:uncharacterized sporulation protein YeaH/YhbH (DUF444 family)
MSFDDWWSEWLASGHELSPYGSDYNDMKVAYDAGREQGQKDATKIEDAPYMSIWIAKEEAVAERDELKAQLKAIREISACRLDRAITARKERDRLRDAIENALPYMEPSDTRFLLQAALKGAFD